MSGFFTNSHTDLLKVLNEISALMSFARLIIGSYRHTQTHAAVVKATACPADNFGHGLVYLRYNGHD
jgi:hypothetical protein